MGITFNIISMCGIAGFTGHPNRSLLKRMSDSLIHRGPDDEASYQDEFCSLGMRRLAIIDLTPGIYPLTNEKKTLFCIFNGEIYNYASVREELFKKGHRFKTDCDGEVIVHGYEEWGERVLKKLNGMFAIALYDKACQTLLLIRDRLGKKPLYYSLMGKDLIFASEIKAILVHPSVKRQLNFLSLAKYLRYEYVPTPSTMFEGVFKLPPGQVLTFDQGKIRKKEYWDATFPAQSPTLRSRLSRDSGQEPSEEEMIKELDLKVSDAVKIRLISDVPLGVFLSGGIDSSTIAYYASKFSAKKLQSFSIGFEEETFDERHFARLSAQAIGTDHHEAILDSKKTIKLIPAIYETLDEPLSDPSLIPTYLLSAFARKRVTVSLGGDGGDELFMGYPTYQAHRLALLADRLPVTIKHQLLPRLMALLPTSFSNLSSDFLLKKFVQGLPYSTHLRHQLWLGLDSEFGQNILAADLKEAIKGDVYEDIARYQKKHLPFWEQLIYLDLKTYLLDDILVKVDRASMMNSLEVRAPFLDYRVVDFVNSLSANVKMKGFQTKYLLKKLMQGRLPPEIIQRKKKGFGIPIAEWLTKELKPLMMELLAEKRIKQEGLFEPAVVQKLIDDHLSRRKNNRKELWTLMVWEMWKDRPKK